MYTINGKTLASMLMTSVTLGCALRFLKMPGKYGLFVMAKIIKAGMSLLKTMV